jgi:hypothetical protein
VNPNEVLSSRSYFTTDSQSVSQYVLVSSTLVGLVTRYYFLSKCYCLKFAVLYLLGALSDERTGLQFAAKSLNSLSRSEPETILYSHLPNLEGQVPVFISPETRWPSYTPGHWVPFTSSLTIRRDTSIFSTYNQSAWTYRKQYSLFYYYKRYMMPSNGAYVTTSKLEASPSLL